MNIYELEAKLVSLENEISRLRATSITFTTGVPTWEPECCRPKFALDAATNILYYYSNDMWNNVQL